MNKTRAPKTTFSDEFIEMLTRDLWAWADATELIWIGSFAAKHKLHRQRLSEMAGYNVEFRKAYEYAKQKQENFLVLGALGKKLEQAMAIFALKNVAGYRDVVVDETKDADIVNEEIAFVGIPVNGKGNLRFKEFLN